MSKPNCGSVVPNGVRFSQVQRELPAARGRDAREEAEHDRDAEHREAAQRLEDLLVAVELRVELRVHRSGR